MSLIKQTELYTAAGTYTYTIPAGVSSVEFHLWGAGGAKGGNGPSVDVEVGTTSSSVQSGSQLVVTGQEYVQIGTQQVQVGTQQVQTGTTQVQVGTKRVAYQVATTNSKGRSTGLTIGQSAFASGVGNNGKSTTTNYTTAYRDEPVYETRPVYTTVPVYETQPVFGFRDVTGLQPVFTTVTNPVFESKAGGQGADGGGGGYSYKKIKVSEGDVLEITVGSSGVNHVGGLSLSSPVNYGGGNGGSSTNGGRGGGGGGATVVRLNGTVIAVAAGGGGGGGGGLIGVAGTVGSAATNSGVGSGDQGQGKSSGSGPATGGGGGGGWYSGIAGASGSRGAGGIGGVSYGGIIESGSGTAPGGRTVSVYPGRNAGYAGVSGAAYIAFVKSFNIKIKRTSAWTFVDRSWVKVSGEWKEILNGWVKVSGQWYPLITNRSVEGAEDTANPIITYSISANRANVSEGSAVSFTVSTTGLANGTQVPYSATGIQSTDLQVGSLTGNFTVGTGETITFVPKVNNTTNGTRTLKVILHNTTESASTTVLDTSQTPVYTLNANVASINEGQAARFTLGNVNGIAGETINYTVTGISSSRLASGSDGLTGTFVVGSDETAVIAVRENSLTDGNGTITMTLVGKGASDSVTIVDSSQTPSGNETFTSTAYFTVPAGVSSIDVVMIGAGGSGGDGAGVDGAPDGGWNGTIVSTSLTVTPGELLAMVVGSGGTRVAYNSGSPGNAGTASQIRRGNTVLATAAGGSGGKRANGSSQDGRSSGSPFNGTGGAGRWGAGADAGNGGVGAGGGGIDGKASGYYSGNGGRGEIRISWG